MKIAIRTASAAFADRPEVAVAWILRRLADDLERDGLPLTWAAMRRRGQVCGTDEIVVPIYDSNGNRVGTMRQ